MKTLQQQTSQEIIPPPKKHGSLIEESMSQPTWLKILPFATVNIVVLAILAIVYIGSQASIESSKAVTAQANAIEHQAKAVEHQAEAIERQTAIIEGMAERQAYISSDKKEIIDTIFVVGAICLGVYAIGKLFSES